MKKVLLSALAIATLAASPALAKQKTAGWPADQIGKEVTIPFIAFDNLYNFQADDDKGVWLEDQSRRWYYAKVLGPCTDLPFAEAIGVDTRFGGDQLDRTGTILVRHQRCPLTSLTASNGPPVKAKKAGTPNKG